jgi:hypothetical protein
LPQPVVKGLILQGVVAVSKPLSLEYVHSLGRSWEEQVRKIGGEAGRRGPWAAAPHLSHHLSRAHLPGMNGTVNTTLHSPLEGEEPGQRWPGRALAGPVFVRF